METSARYVLQGSLKYASRDGEMTDAQFIEMNAPTGRHARQVASLRQAIVHSIVEEQRNVTEVNTPEDVAAAQAPEVDEDDAEIQIVDGIEIINIMARSSVDLGAVYKVARELFVLKGVVKVDGDVQMTQTLLDNMTAQDFETLVGSYIANFTLPS
jgi:hypothetical protein